MLSGVYVGLKMAWRNEEGDISKVVLYFLSKAILLDYFADKSS